jgi:hypothetical protein
MLNEGMGMKDKMSVGFGQVMEEGIDSKCNVILELFGKDGKLKDTREIHNVDTTLAHAMVADQFDDSPSIAKPGWMEVGTGTGQDAADSTLAAYISGSRTAITSATATAAAVVFVCTFAAGVGTGAITEAGLFNVVTQNTTDLILVSSFAAVNKAAGDSLVVTWTLTFS